MSELIILGSGTGIPYLRRASPALLLISQSSVMLIDSGSGTLRRMLEVGMTYQDIDLILYTHIHPDHVSELVPILFASKYAELPRKKGLTILAGPGFNSYFAQLREIHGRWIEPQSYDLTVHETSKAPFLFRDMKIFSKPMVHMPESVGFRIEFEDGRSVVVSGDTDYCQTIVDLASETDLLVLECSFPDGKKVEGHLTPSLAGRIGLESRCKRLILTHLYPVCDQFQIAKPCKEIFGGEVILAEDLMKIRI
ncbi:MAG: MBL fold metallo-hydrolase [Syntrophaceae bacterium]|nr:MBL fold metallo-hydrolase [Syntrophaceae bacterium]